MEYALREISIRVLPGQYFDSETGLHQNYHRDYDPRTGRYLQPDPIGLAGGSNLYGYSNLNPITNIDPLGLDTWSGAGDEVGGFLVFAGTSTMYGFVTNWSTGEKCYIESRCYKLGAGIAGGITAESIWIPNGPKFGKDLAGTSNGMGVEGGLGGYISGTPANTFTYANDGAFSITEGAGIGAGFAEYAQKCNTRVIFCEKTPKNKSCDNNGKRN